MPTPSLTPLDVGASALSPHARRSSAPPKTETNRVLLQSIRAVLHVGVVLALTWRSTLLGDALHPFDRSLANEWIHLLFFVDAVKNVTVWDGSNGTSTTTMATPVTLPNFLLEIEEEIAANVDDTDAISIGFMSRASSYPVGLLFTINETKQHMHGAIDNYFRLPDLALDDYVVAPRPGREDRAAPGVVLPLPMLTVYQSNKTSEFVNTYVVSGTNESEWPPALRRDGVAPDTREFFDLIDVMELRFLVGAKEKKDSERDAQSELLLAWWILFTYDLQSQGHLEVSMNYGVATVPTTINDADQPVETTKYEVADVPPVFFDTNTLFDWCLLTLIAIYQIVEFVLKWSNSTTAFLLLSPRVAGSRDSRRRRAWRAFKREARDWWFWFVLVLNVMTVSCFFQSWYHAYRLELRDRICLLFAGCSALHWMSLVRYLQFHARFHILGLTLYRGLPRVAQFLVGVLPIFVGYVLFGTIMFGAKVPRFQGVGTTAVTLFSVANGDEIHDTFNAVAFTPIIGQLYVYSYMILFSYVVLMVCIGIIEDAFFSAVFPESWPSLDKMEREAAQ
ncbi:TPA: hypothetical protein N0F65_007618 [Lagenidium giganteum]|uniref:Polycystin cation channel PKD1/PKD2 domain-containing protein n=1 Tax=Lagenidium giganteum TaxID=4803 RepID=A0AAV2ZAE8_9STRA|nr:TPA: hypothetical protein N0F65_007618 [Lagenidium giganteum]